MENEYLARAAVNGTDTVAVMAAVNGTDTVVVIGNTDNGFHAVGEYGFPDLVGIGFVDGEKKTAYAVSVCRQKGFGIKKFRPLFEIPFEFSPKVKRLGLNWPTMLGHFWTSPCPIGHLL